MLFQVDCVRFPCPTAFHPGLDLVASMLSYQSIENTVGRRVLKLLTGVPIYSTALMDESYFPPKCCVVEIPANVIQGHLSFTHRALYRRKVKEYAVPAGERLFCPYSTCARWNPPSKKVIKLGMIKCRYC